MNVFPSECLCKNCPHLSDCEALAREFDRFWNDEMTFEQYLREEEAFRKELLSE